MGNGNTEKDLILLKPGEKMPQEILAKLKDANYKYSKNKKFPEYLRQIEQIFNIIPPKHKTTELQYYLGGFIEGEGSLNVSAKKQNNTMYGLIIDPEFSITQHINGVHNLYLALYVFQTGRIRYKSGSNATLVYTVDNRKTLLDKILPFYEKYVNTFGSPIKKIKMCQFQELLNLYKNKIHLDLELFLVKILPLWENMRMQKDQSNQSFASLEEARQYVQDFVKTKTK